MGPAPVDYLEALRLKRAAAEFTLGGRSFTAQRARLYLHYQLRSLLQEAAGLPPADLTSRYVALAAGITVEDVDLGEPSELLTAFMLLADFNRFRGTLPVLWPTGAPGGGGREDYPNRALASMVTRLSHAYGWEVDHILDLGPEEAACYLQEAVIIDHQAREFDWRIGGGAVGEKGQRREFPPLRWGRPPEDGQPTEGGPGRPVRPGIPERFMPQGVIVRNRPRERK